MSETQRFHPNVERVRRAWWRSGLVDGTDPADLGSIPGLGRWFGEFQRRIEKSPQVG